MTRSWLPSLLLLFLFLSGCKPKEWITETVERAAEQKVKPVTDKIDELEKQVKTIDLGSQQAQKLLEEKVQQAKQLAQEAATLHDLARKRLDEIEIERGVNQRKIEAELKETKLRLADDAAKELQAQKKKKEREEAVFSWLRTFLLFLGAITVIKIFAKPLWRVIQTILIKNLAPAPRQIFKVPAK